MEDQYQSGHQEVIPCLLSDYDDDVKAHRESFQAFMTRQAEEHWAAEISSLDIEGSADRITTVIEQEVNRLAKKLDVIATAMAAETDGAQANRLLAMIPTKLNLMAKLEDLAFSRLQPVEGSAERPLAIEDISPSTSQGSTQCEISGRLDGYDRPVSQTPIKKRSDSPIKIESPTPTKRRRVNFSEDGASRVSEPTPALSHALRTSSPSLPQALLSKGGNSGSGHQDPSPSPLLPQSKIAPAHHATPSNQRYDLSKAAPPSAKKKPAQTKKPAQASKPCHGKPLCISRASLHEVQHREWIFNFQSSGWCVLRCGRFNCLNQGPGMLTRLRKHFEKGCPVAGHPLGTDWELVERFGYQVTGGIFDTGSVQQISAWVNNSNDVIRYTNMNTSEK